MFHWIICYCTIEVTFSKSGKKCVERIRLVLFTRDVKLNERD